MDPDSAVFESRVETPGRSLEGREKRSIIYPSEGLWG